MANVKDERDSLLDKIFNAKAEIKAKADLEISKLETAANRVKLSMASEKSRQEEALKQNAAAQSASKDPSVFIGSQPADISDLPT